MKGETRVSSAVQALRPAVAGLEPRVGIVLGSGLGELVRAVENARRMPYAEIPGFPAATVSGHTGELVAGTLEGVPVILQSGRLHLYEGYAAEEVVLPIRVLAELGVEVLVVTNAAGALRPGLRPPALMLLADHINLQWRSPLVGPGVESEDRFVDMSAPYDPVLRARAHAIALAESIRLEEGVYAAVPGPSYETSAEVTMLRQMGADAVGMSTVPEVLVARARGMRVLGISSVTNLATGIGREPLSHEEVLAASRQVASDLERLVRGVLRALAS